MCEFSSLLLLLFFHSLDSSPELNLSSSSSSIQCLLVPLHYLRWSSSFLCLLSTSVALNKDQNKLTDRFDFDLQNKSRLQYLETSNIPHPHHGESMNGDCFAYGCLQVTFGLGWGEFDSSFRFLSFRVSTRDSDSHRRLAFLSFFSSCIRQQRRYQVRTCLRSSPFQAADLQLVASSVSIRRSLTPFPLPSELDTESIPPLSTIFSLTGAALLAL